MPTGMRKHYRVVIVICCFLVLFANQGLPATSFNVYQTYLVQLPGVGAVGGSLVLTVRAFVSLLVLLVVTPFYRRIDARYGVLLATLCTAAGFAVYGLWESLAGLCAGSVLTGIGYGLGGMVATTIILGRWFHGHVGTAAGFIGMGSGMAALIIPTIAAEIIEAAGLPTAFLAEAALALVLALVFVVFLRSNPQQMGLEPYEAPAPAPRKRRGKKAKEANGSVGTKAEKAPDAATEARAAARTLPGNPLPRLDKALMMVAMTLMGGVAVTGFGYFSVLLTSSGVNVIAAAVITSIGGACLAVGKLACGWTFDKLGTRSGTIVFFAILIVGSVLCVLAGSGDATEGFFAAVFFCAGVSVATTGIAVWSLELSGPQTTMRNVRDFNLAYATGGFVFNMMPGVLVQATGTYVTTYVVLTAFAVVGAVLIVGVYTRRMRG